MVAIPCGFESHPRYLDGLELGVEDVRHGKNETVSVGVPATIIEPPRAGQPTPVSRWPLW